MTMYKYYAIIEPSESSYLVTFPDLENCFTQGDDIAHAVEMAEDVLELMLPDYEEDGSVPTPSKAKDIQLPEGASLVLITVNSDNFWKADVINDYSDV